MSCDVRLYNTSYATLPDPTIELVPVDTSSSTLPTNLIAAVKNGPFKRGHGAALIFGTPMCTYEVVVHDVGMTYGATIIPNLNGNIDGELEVVLSRAPTSASGGRVTSPGQLRAYIGAQTWSQEETHAILGTIQAYALVRGAQSSDLLRVVDNLGAVLNRVGIDGLAV